MPLWRTVSRQSHQSRKSLEAENAAAAVATSPVDRITSHNDPKASAQQAASTAWLAGHLNHLTPEQEAKFVEFKKLVEEKGYFRPGNEQEGVRPSHDDATLLRFLRARKFDINGAYGQFKDTEEWRKENDIEALYRNIDVESYEEARGVYPQWTGRRDRRGIPIYVFVVKHLNSKNMAAYSSKASTHVPAETHKSSKVPARLLRLFALYENLLHFVMPLCSALPRPNPETPIVTSTNIVDISGVGLKQFWNLRSHMQDASVLATAHYPETLDRIFIIGAPAFFPTVWSWIKRWFDPVTVSKIFILSASEVKPTLTSFMEPSSFPKHYGGDLDWQWGDRPLLDDAALALAPALETRSEAGVDPHLCVRGPILFQDGKLEVVGTENGKRRDHFLPVNLPEDSSTQTVTTATTTATTSTPLSTTETTNTEVGEGENEGEAPLNVSEKDIEVAAAAAQAVAEPVTKPLPTPDEKEKTVLETTGNTAAAAP